MEINKKTLFRVFLVAFGCIVLYWLLNEWGQVRSFFGAITGVLSPFIFGGVLAFVLNVPMRAIENGMLKKMTNATIKRAIALVITFIGLLLVVSLVFWLLIPQIIDTVNSLGPQLSTFVAGAQKYIVSILEEKPELLEWIYANTNFENMSWSSMVEKGLSVLGNSFSSIVSGTISAVGTIFSGVFNGVIAIVFGVYCLCQKETLARQGRKLLYAFAKEKTADGIVRTLRLTNATFSNFLSGQCVEVCILGALFAISMAIFRMPYIPLISVVIAVTAFIPIVGAWTGCIIGAFLILVKDPMLAVWFVLMFLVIQQIENSLIYPRVVGTSVGLSGMWVLLAVAVGGELMGVVGMFLMIPVVSVLYTLIREQTNKRLAKRTVAEEKLQPQPVELRSRFKENRQRNKQKNLLKKALKKDKEKEDKKD